MPKYIILHIITPFALVSVATFSDIEFRDALAIRYHQTLSKLPADCDGCGAEFALQHALDCRKGGLIIQRHNEAQLSLSRGGLGLRSLSHHSAAAYVLNLFNALIPSADAITLDDIVSSLYRQHALSSLNLHMDPPEFQVALKWWLGMDLAQGFNCTFCPSLALDPLGHYAITCKHGDDVVSHHNKLRDVFVECCSRANVSAQVEVGSGFGHDKRNTRPAHVLVPNWSLGKPAAFDLTITSLLNPSILSEAGVMAGFAASVAESVETYGCWGAEAREPLSRLATRLAIPMRCTKSKATASIYGKLSLTLVVSEKCTIASKLLTQLEEWWLGMGVSQINSCPYCTAHSLDPIGFTTFLWSHAGEPALVSRWRPADIIIVGWDRGKPAALDLTLTSPLCSAILSESCHQACAAALAAEVRKLHSNGLKCQELGWSCIPLAVETYGNWGKEAHDTFSRLASYLAIHQSSLKSAVVAEIYGD
eukprot:Em0012g446a